MFSLDYAVNVRGVFNVAKAFLSHMIERKAGVIVNLASIGYQLLAIGYWRKANWPLTRHG